MTPDLTDRAPAPSSTAWDELRKRLALSEVRPFVHQVVQSPWDDIIDANGLHGSIQERIRKLIEHCSAAEAIRCLTIIAQQGYGKTQLFAWVRQWLETGDRGAFVYVTPYLLRRLAIQALWARFFP